MATPIDWPRFYKTSRLTDEDILNIYLTGSRAWGTAEVGSDFDFFVVVKQDCAVEFALPLGPNHMITLEEGDYNIEIMRPSFFWDLLILKNHNVQAISTLFSPPELIYKETITTWKRDFKLNPWKLVRALLRKCPSSFNRAEYYFRHIKARIDSKRDQYPESDETVPADVRGASIQLLARKAKKMMAHSLRYVEMGIQLMETGKITDLHAGKQYWEEMKAETSLDGEFYDSKYHPKMREILAKISLSVKENPDLDEDKVGVPSQYHKLIDMMNTPTQSTSFESAIKNEITGLICEAITAKKETQFNDDFEKHFHSIQDYLDNVKDELETAGRALDGDLWRVSLRTCQILQTTAYSSQNSAEGTPPTESGSSTPVDWKKVKAATPQGVWRRAFAEAAVGCRSLKAVTIMDRQGHTGREYVAAASPKHRRALLASTPGEESGPAI